MKVVGGVWQGSEGVWKGKSNSTTVVGSCIVIMDSSSSFRMTLLRVAVREQVSPLRARKFVLGTRYRKI